MKEKQIIAGTVTSSSNSQTGRRRISVSFDFAEYEQNKKEIFDSMFKELPVTIAVAVITNDAATEDMQPRETHPYGNEAKILKQSSFFRTPEVWRAIGTDKEYLEWLRHQPCCYCYLVKQKASYDNVSEAAHVRRIANGAGIAIKPEYSAIPFCHTHHKMQHDHGEVAVGGKEFVDKKRIEYVSKWAWETLKEQLGCEHWYDVMPEVLKLWALKHSVDKYLPKTYKGEIK